MSATYTKLQNGEWGIRVSGAAAAPGREVVVTKKNGETKRETVGRVVWSGDGVSLCTIAAPAGAGSRKAAYSPRAGRGRLSDDDRCELCDRNKWTCGHCIGW